MAEYQRSLQASVRSGAARRRLPWLENMELLRKTVRRTRRLVRQLLGREPRNTVEVSCRRESHGSSYGGWAIARR